MWAGGRKDERVWCFDWASYAISPPPSPSVVPPPLCYFPYSLPLCAHLQDARCIELALHERGHVGALVRQEDEGALGLLCI